jgi:hypothetical protein
MSRDSQRYRKTYSYYRVQPKTELLEVIVDETLDWKHSVRAASTASVSLAGSTPLTIDDVTLADEDRVLLKDQGSGAENGIYYFEVSNGSYALTRASDARQDTISCGATTYVEEGAANSGKIFIMSTTGPITVGTTAMSWTLFSGAGGGVGGSGTTNYVSKFTASGSVGNSSIYDNSTGIGIGTTSFSGRFFVSGSDSAIPTAVIKGGYASLFDVQNFSGTSILFATGTLGSVGGRVGIGTSQPDAKFQVSSSYGGSAHGISIGKPNFLGLASNAYTSLQHNFYGGDGTTQRMMIDSAGNTILGGAFPGLTANTARLFVTGSSTAAEQGIVYRAGVASPTGGVGVLDIQNSSESSLLFVSASGFVGVGTNMGTSSASAAGSIFFVSSSLTGNAASAFIVGGQAFGTSVNISKAFTHLFWGAGGSTNEYMRINSAGNVGIGTSSGINSKLVVNGSASVTGSILPGASDTYPLGSSTNFWSTVYATNLTGSLTKLADGTSYLVAGSNVTITTGSNGAVTIESTAGGGGVGGSGTTNFIPKFTAGSTLGDSILQEGLGVNYTGTPSTAFLTSSGYGITFTQPQIWSLPDNSFGLNIDGKFKFDTGGGGSLGIGTPSTPGQKLHIVISEPSTDNPFVSDAPRVIRLQNSSTTANNSTAIVNADGSGSDINSFIQFINVDHTSDKGALSFGTRDGASSGERLRINEVGNVGIGTTSPNAILDVSKAVGSVDIRLSNGGTAYMNLYGGSGVGSLNLVAVQNEPLIFGTNNTETVRISAAGNVGIGTSTINARLDILSSDGDEGVIVRQGTTAPASAKPILQAKGYDDGTVLWVSGSSTHGARVGIGTTNPRSICMLDVGSKGSTGTNNYVNVEASSTGECGYSWSAGGANPLWKFSRAASTSNISLIEQGSSNVALLCEYSTGYVGIGTNDPSEKLHVTSGSIKVDTAGYGVRLSSSPTNADAQTLDCYSESTISARLYALTGGGLTMSSNKNTLQVTKVGRLVTITGFLKIDEVTKPSVSGRLVIDMSVSSSPPLAAVQTAASVWIDQFDATMTDPVQAYIDTTDPYIYIDRLVNGSKADLASYVDTSSEVKILVTYVAA